MGHRGIDLLGDKRGVSFYVEEGNFTRNELMDTDFGPSKGGSFASRAQDGLEVQIYASADNTVAPLSTGIAIGRINSPIFEGALPKATANSGTYQRRLCRVELDGSLGKVKLIATNQEITPGTPLGVSASDKTAYDKEEDAATNVYAFEAVAANAGGYVKVFRKGVSQNVAD